MNKRLLIDVERGRTVKGWKPRRLGGGLGGRPKKIVPGTFSLNFPTSPSPPSRTAVDASSHSTPSQSLPKHQVSVSEDLLQGVDSEEEEEDEVDLFNEVEDSEDVVGSNREVGLAGEIEVGSEEEEEEEGVGLVVIGVGSVVGIGEEDLVVVVVDLVEEEVGLVVLRGEGLVRCVFQLSPSLMLARLSATISLTFSFSRVQTQDNGYGARGGGGMGGGEKRPFDQGQMGGRGGYGGGGGGGGYEDKRPRY